jgi:hypothetical protein
MSSQITVDLSQTEPNALTAMNIHQLTVMQLLTVTLWVEVLERSWMFIM